MGILKGSLTLRRYRVDGVVPDDFRDRYTEALTDNAFHDPASALHTGETVGWCLTQNLLYTDFSNRERWLMNHFILAAMRVDKKTLPAKLFRAHLDQRLTQWCQANGCTRAPASIRTETRELLEQEMLTKCLPRVQVTEFCWNVIEGWVLLHSTSESVNDRFRSLFRNTFGLTLEPASPLDFLDDPDLAASLELCGVSDYRPPLPQQEQTP